MPGSDIWEDSFVKSGIIAALHTFILVSFQKMAQLLKRMIFPQEFSLNSDREVLRMM